MPGSRPLPTPALEALIRAQCQRLPPIPDERLFLGVTHPGASGWDVVQIARGADRFSLAVRGPWLDPELLDRITPYARWYFAPSLMLLALACHGRVAYEDLMAVFVPNEAAAAGWGAPTDDDDFDAALVAQALAGLPGRADELASPGAVRPSLPPTVYSAEGFVQSYGCFPPEEHPVVSRFLDWLAQCWGGEEGDPTVRRAQRHLWQRQAVLR